jgi:hypothetical protein
VSWNEDLDARFKKLPARRAPKRLTASLMAAAALYQKPWHARPWWTWSVPARAAFAACVALGAVLVASGAHSLLPRAEWLIALSRAWVKVAWELRAPLFVSFVLTAAPAAALTGLAAAGRTFRRTR